MKNKITDIQPQVKHEGRFSVFINGAFSFGISDFDLLKLSLSVGDCLTDEELSDIRAALDESKCQDYANALVCRKMYTEKELYRKLSARGYTDDVCQTVIDRLKEYNYINDEEYVRLYIEEKKGQYGEFKIRQKLYEKGISRETVDNEMSDFESGDAAYLLLKQKLRGGKPKRDDRQKYIRFLASKGFSFDEAKDALNAYTEDTDGFDDE